MLALVFQCLIILRENSDWDWLQSGRCYRGHDYSGTNDSIFWMVGLSLFGLTLLLTLTPLEIYITTVMSSLVKLYEALKSTTRTRIQKLKTPQTFIHATTKDQLSLCFTLIIDTAVFLLLTFLTTLTWLLINFLSVWSYGEGFYAFEMLCYIAFGVWNTWDIIDLKLSNRLLVIGSELRWGFGQVLPTALVGGIAFSAFDGFSGEFVATPSSNHMAFFVHAFGLFLLWRVYTRSQMHRNASD